MDRHTRDDHSASLDILDQSFWDRRRPPIGSNGSAHLGNNLGPSYLDTSAHDQDHEHHELDPLAGLSSQKRDYSSSSSSSDHELDHRPKKQTSGNKKSQADKEKTGPRRATQACLRCRKQKLRCVGGYPCDRCVKSKNTCDFGRVSSASASAPGQRDSGGADVATARLEQLESSVANLLAGLAGGSGGHPPAFPNGADVLHQHFPVGHDPRDHSPFVDPPHAGPSWSTLSSSIPRPHADRLGSIHTRPSNTSIAEELARSHVRFSTSPSHILGPQHDLSPSTYSGSVFGSHSLENDDRKASIGSKRKGKSKGQEPEERLAAVTDQPYDPPFKALTYEPEVWDNREASRMNTPERGSFTFSRDEMAGPPHWHDYRTLRHRATPLSTGIVDLRVAEALFQFFIDHCHAFMPIVNVALDDVFNVIRSSPALFSAMLAIAARFYPRATERFTRMRRGEYPVLEEVVPARLANLAEMHLAYTILGKTFALSDVQAILLLAAWGLQPDGRGPDAWLVTGHAARVSRRLGVYKVLGHATETAKRTKQGTEEWTKLEAFLPQWRTWLCWFGYDNFLSLGFGRPQSTYFESVEEDAFLQIRLAQALPRPGSPASMALHGDIYIAGLVSLAQIGKDLTKWGIMLANPERAREDQMMRKWGEDQDLKLSTMFKELNGRLDDWSKLWVWTGSPYALYLGSSVRIARLQAEHLRLCLNSYALKAGADEDEDIGQCLKKALNAAMGTIQTHFESSQTDLALSFATDYLTIALAQAAVFLIRISNAPESVRKVVNVDLSVVAHYLKMSVDLLESSDVTEVRLPTFLAKTIREIAVAAGITSLGTSAYDEEKPEKRSSNPSAPDFSLDHATSTGVQTSSSPIVGLGAALPGLTPHPSAAPNPGANGDAPDFADPFSDRQMFDLSSLLGLPGDNGAQGENNNFGHGEMFHFGPQDGYMSEFGFGMGSLAGLNGLGGLTDMGNLGNVAPLGMGEDTVSPELDLGLGYGVNHS